MKNVSLSNGFILLFVMVMFSCNNDLDDAPQPLSSPVEIKLSETETRMATEGKTFVWDFFSAACEELNESENLVLSPLSLNMALAMVWNGATGETRQAIQQAMGMSDYSISEVNEYFKKLREGIIKTDPSTQVALANSIWYDETFSVKPNFIQTNQEWYNAAVKAINFRDPNAPKMINNWCSDNTNQLIKKIIDTIDPNACMYLLNALYFKGVWANDFGFETSATADALFRKKNGTQVSVKMMNQHNTLPYSINDYYAITALPYGNHAFSMLFILPNENVSFDTVLAQLKQPGAWESPFERVYDVDLFIPKFKIDEPLSDMNKTLTRLGMGMAFSPAADFSGISDRGLNLSKVVQKTFIEVNEKGTEAAAVTLVDMVTSAMPPSTQQATFRADRPFLFAIQENSTGIILFMGKIGEPK